ncbi:MAG: site-specific integrase [Lachnospiraceae bacterium]|nr:site-specific integrase [Lachnospiraceae bacterium]
MPRHGENIFKRKDNRWEGRYISHYDNNGKAVYKSIYAKTYRDAKAKLESAKEQNGRIVENQSIRTFKDLLYYWLEFNNAKNKNSTQDKYEYMIRKHIVPSLGGIAIQKINVALINKFIDEKLQQLSNSYVRTMAIILKSTLQLAVKERFINITNFDIAIPVAKKSELSILQPIEQKRLESYLLSNMNCSNLGIYISLYSGLRLGEICALKWDDIDFNNRIIKVRSTIVRVKNIDNNGTHLEIGTPKTASSNREVPITDNLFVLLKEINQLSSSQYVISNSNNFVSTRTFEDRFQKTLKKAKIKKYNYHALRHTFATNCVICGVDVKSLSEILGHSNVSITLNTYVHSSMDLKKKQLNKLKTMIA